MSLYTCGFNLNHQISKTQPVCAKVPWTQINETKSPESTVEERNELLVTFGFSYIAVCNANQVKIKGFDQHADRDIILPDKDDEAMGTKSAHNNTIISVSAYKTHLHLIQANGNVWKLNLLDKGRPNDQVLCKTPSQNSSDARTRTNDGLDRKDSYNRSPLESNSNQIDYDPLKRLLCEASSLEAQAKPSDNISETTRNHVDVRTPFKDPTEFQEKDPDRVSEDLPRGLIQINHIFSCELGISDDETSSNETFDAIGNKTDQDNNNDAKRRKTSDRQNINRNQMMKCVSSDNVQLLLSEQGQVFNIPGRMDHFLGIVITDVACGFEHCLALAQNGLVFSWGNGSRGQLGYPLIGFGLDSSDPHEIRALSGLGVRQISAGGWHSVARTEDGTLYSWGWNNSGQLGIKGRLNQVVYDPYPVSFARDFGSHPKDITTQPKDIDCQQDDLDCQEVKIVAVACGSRHTLALADDGSVWGCGWNEYNQLNLGADVSKVTTMTRIPTPHGSGVVKVYAGHWNSALVMR